MKRRRWTEVDRSAVTSRAKTFGQEYKPYLDQDDIDELVEKLGRTRAAVVRQVQRMGYSVKRWRGYGEGG